MPVDRWLNGLRDRRARARIALRVQRLALGLEGDWRSVGEGVRELRIPEGSGYRLYYAWDGAAIVVLLCGGDKSSQRHDIETAKNSGKTTVSTRKRWAPYRAADYLKTPRDKAAYLNAAIDDGEPVVLLAALRSIVDAAGGMTWLARQTGLSRESLYKALSTSGNPRLTSLNTILGALGLELAIKPRRAA